MGDDGGGGFESSSYTTDNSYSYSGGYTEEAHHSNSYSGVGHDSVDNYSRNISTEIDTGLPVNKGDETNYQPVKTESFDDTVEAQDKDWSVAEPHSPTVEEPLLDEDNITTEYSPEYKEKMNGDGLLKPMFGLGGDSYNQERSPDNDGCSVDDCCYYTVVCCDCTIL